MSTDTDIYYHMNVIRNSISYIDRHLEIANYYSNIGRQMLVCEHIRISVNSVKMLLRFVYKSKVKDSIAVTCSMSPVYRLIERIEELYGQGWGDICRRLTDKKRPRGTLYEGVCDLRINKKMMC